LQTSNHVIKAIYKFTDLQKIRSERERQVNKQSLSELPVDLDVIAGWFFAWERDIFNT